MPLFSNTKSLIKGVVLLFGAIISSNLSAQQSASNVSDTSEYGHVPELEYIASNFPTYHSFMFRRIVQEYIANENGFLLDVKLDTAYLIFSRDTKDTTVYTGNFYGDIYAKTPFKKANDIEKLPLTIQLTSKGKIAKLLNWQIFRDYFVSALSKQAQADLINATFFRQQKELLNNEKVIRLMVMEDLGYMFDIFGDTVDLNVEYLRVKGVKSPFTQKTLQILGNLKIERVDGAANTLKFKAQNKADGPIKQELMDEAVRMMREREKNMTTKTQILNVGLNSEQEIDYNLGAKCIMTATFSDVVVLNLQSRGNVRVYQLWDYRYPWEVDQK